MSMIMLIIGIMITINLRNRIRIMNAIETSAAYMGMLKDTDTSTSRANACLTKRFVRKVYAHACASHHHMTTVSRKGKYILKTRIPESSKPRGPKRSANQLGAVPGSSEPCRVAGHRAG